MGNGVARGGGKHVCSGNVRTGQGKGEGGMTTYKYKSNDT